MTRIALMNDYQSVAMGCADWSRLPQGCELEIFHDHMTGVEVLAERLADFDVVMAMRERTPFPRALLERLPRLKMVANTAMWNVSLDIDCCTELGILVCGTAGGSMPTFELTWGLIFAITRNIPLEHHETQGGAWQSSLGIELDGRTLGLLGLGTIGGRVAEVGRVFGMRVIAWSTNLTAEQARACGAELAASKEAVLREADILSLHYRLGERSRGMIAEAELALMKPGAYLINTSRGPLVKEAALIDALQRRAIGGAALDVFDQEPLAPDHAYRKLDNVIVSPHMGYVTEETYGIFYGETLENILAYLKDEPLRVLNPDVLENRRR
ncbi:MAG: D-2-hydroxyacid dehydrogenase family protein [SAR324 cluster bacterium]|nr:D-2-hydroxyacid dehydrogenase family protein [SAR324 cluster bacterium]